jgi:hypothetical protein
MFQQHVLFQCKSMLMAANDVNTGLAAHDFHRVFYGIQNLLNAAGNVSKALWGQRDKLEEQRKPLRDSIGVDNNSPLHEVMMRNNFEHFDERLDRWWRESAQHNSMDFNLSPRNAVHGFDEIDRFRVFDPHTTDLTFWGDDFNMQQLIDEALRILPTLQEEANKPHYERPEDRAAAANGIGLHEAMPDDGRNAPHD